METNTDQKIALVKATEQGLRFETYSSLGQLFEFLIKQLFIELHKEHQTDGALQIIQDLLTRQTTILKRY